MCLCILIPFDPEFGAGPISRLLGRICGLFHVENRACFHLLLHAHKLRFKLFGTFKPESLIILHGFRFQLSHFSSKVFCGLVVNVVRYLLCVLGRNYAYPLQRLLRVVRQLFVRSAMDVERGYCLGHYSAACRVGRHSLRFGLTSRVDRHKANRVNFNERRLLIFLGRGQLRMDPRSTIRLEILKL